LLAANQAASSPCAPNVSRDALAMMAINALADDDIDWTLA
jgi:hypothetical protein